MIPTEEVVLVDDGGRPIGTADKAAVHTTETPLHLAFSCHVYSDSGLVLVTRRALSKLTWPGVWTNSFCGHPAPGEPMEDAAVRRAAFELGVAIEGLTLALPDFRYRAVDASGIVENEVCPVYRAHVASPLAPNPDEVAEWQWVSPAALRTAVEATPFAFSPWIVLQLEAWSY
jgi:isopentenyl-diphosphate delta-isomerase